LTAPTTSTFAAQRRIGIFGGAFDPPHLAHQALAQAALAQFELDTLLLIPTGQAWHKSRALTSAEHRLAMVRLAFADLPKVHIDAREIHRAGPTYTYDTLLELRTEHPQAHFFLFIGGDQAQAFSSWYQWQGILQLATLVIAQRGAPTHAQWHNKDLHDGPASEAALRTHLSSATLHMPEMPCNATDIRASVRQGQPLSQWLSPSVWHYIQQQGLYLTNSHSTPTSTSPNQPR
jgi:nicotinate-nucleotide adenylyltransferase